MLECVGKRTAIAGNENGVSSRSPYRRRSAGPCAITGALQALWAADKMVGVGSFPANGAYPPRRRRNAGQQEDGDHGVCLDLAGGHAGRLGVMAPLLVAAAEPDAFRQNEQLGRGVNVLGYDPV